MAEKMAEKSSVNERPDTVVTAGGVPFTIINSLYKLGSGEYFVYDNWVNLEKANMDVSSFAEGTQEINKQFVQYAIAGKKHVQRIDITHDAIKIECKRKQSKQVSRYFFHEVSDGHIRSGGGDRYKKPEHGNFCVSMVVCLGENKTQYHILLMQNGESFGLPWYLGSPNATRHENAIKVKSLDGSESVLISPGSEDRNTFLVCTA